MDDRLAGTDSRVDELDDDIADLSDWNADLESDIGGVADDVDELDDTVDDLTDDVEEIDTDVADLEDDLEGPKARSSASKTTSRRSQRTSRTCRRTSRTSKSGATSSVRCSRTEFGPQRHRAITVLETQLVYLSPVESRSMGETIPIAVPRKGRPLESVLDRIAGRLLDVPELADGITSTLRHEKAVTKDSVDPEEEDVYHRLADYSTVDDPTEPEYTLLRDDRAGKPRRIVFDSVTIPLAGVEGAPDDAAIQLVGREEPFRSLRTHEFALGFDSADLVLEEVVELRPEPLNRIADINARIDPSDTDVQVVTGLGDTVYHTLLATPDVVPSTDRSIGTSSRPTRGRSVSNPDTNDSFRRCSERERSTASNSATPMRAARRKLPSPTRGLASPDRHRLDRPRSRPPARRATVPERNGVARERGGDHRDDRVRSIAAGRGRPRDGTRGRPIRSDSSSGFLKTTPSCVASRGRFPRRRLRHRTRITPKQPLLGVDRLLGQPVDLVFGDAGEFVEAARQQDVQIALEGNELLTGAIGGRPVPNPSVFAPSISAMSAKRSGSLATLYPSVLAGVRAAMVSPWYVWYLFPTGYAIA